MGRARKEKWNSPADEYIFSVEDISIRRLAKNWKGRPGCSVSNLMRRCRTEGWQKRRDEHKRKIEKGTAERLEQRRADERAEQVEQARRRHFMEGERLITVAKRYFEADKRVTRKCPHCGQEVVVRLSPTEQMRPSDARAMIKDGVEIQRKGLGLDEAKVNIFHLGEMAKDFVRVIQKHLDSPDDLQTYKAIRRDIIDMVESAREEVDEMERVSYMPAEYGEKEQRK